MGVLSRIRNRASSVLAFIALGWILYIYFDDLPGFRAVREYSRLRHNLHLLNGTVRGQFDPLSPSGGAWLNLAGLRKGDGMVWARLNTWLLRYQGVGEWRRRSWESDATYIQAFEEEHWDKAVGDGVENG